ncbi:Zinc finger CCCH-type [Trinorchestia longiramus]|nr:Zinc finger CCCH-type [Trinorchestia longiramus]
MFYDVKDRLSHSQWRRLVKKNQRKCRRQAIAKTKSEALLALQSSPWYEAQVQAEEAALAAQKEKEELEHQMLKAEFQARDLALHALFLHEKAVKEEMQLKAKQSCQLLQSTKEAHTQINNRCHNPEPPRPLSPPTHQEVCPFFSKTGACRFGSRCSRYHAYPTVSRTLLLPNLYMGPGELPDARHNSDAMLEYDESDQRQHFRDFFFDITDEAKKFGTLVEVRVCANTALHLRGSVYMRYERSSDACAAAAGLHGRYYAGRTVSCIFVPLESLRAATCGLYFRSACHKGGECNFIHPHPNPDGAYFSCQRGYNLVQKWAELFSLSGKLLLPTSHPLHVDLADLDLDRPVRIDLRGQIMVGDLGPLISTVLRGNPLIPTDLKGNPLIPTDPQGNPLIPTDLKGNPLIPTDLKGNPLIPTDLKGNPLIPTDPRGNPLISTDLKENLIPTDPKKDPLIPTDLLGLLKNDLDHKILANRGNLTKFDLNLLPGVDFKIK